MIRPAIPAPVPGEGLVAGVDGVRRGRAMAVAEGAGVEFSVWDTLGELWGAAKASGVRVVALNMPVGLPGTERRPADIMARELLGARRSSLFWTPPLCVLGTLGADTGGNTTKKP